MMCNLVHGTIHRIYTSYSEKEKKVREKLRCLHFFIFVIIA